MTRIDQNALFAQAKKLKDEMARAEADLKDRMVEGKAGGGAVSVVVNGRQEIQTVRIKPSAVDPSDLSMLEDLVLLAVKDGMEKAKKLNDDVMQRVTSGMGLPPGLI